MPYFFTEREGPRGGFETPPPPPQQQQQQHQPPQQREGAPESEPRSERSEFAPPPRPQPIVRPPNSRPVSSPPRHRSIPQDSGRPHYRVESPPPRYDGPRSGPPRHETSRSEPPRYQGSRHEGSRYEGPRYETSRSEPPSMRYDGTDRWPPSSSHGRVESIPSTPDEVQRYSGQPYERGRITVNPSRDPYSRDPYDVAPQQQYSGPTYTTSPRGGTAAGPGQVVISVEEYRALQGQARELQRLLGQRNGGYRISRPGPGPYNSYPRTIYR
jgi:hypothetical protein